MSDGIIVSDFIQINRQEDHMNNIISKISEIEASAASIMEAAASGETRECMW